jgi:hypothetical protein
MFETLVCMLFARAYITIWFNIAPSLQCAWGLAQLLASRHSCATWFGGSGVVAVTDLVSWGSVLWLRWHGCSGWLYCAVLVMGWVALLLLGLLADVLAQGGVAPADYSWLVATLQICYWQLAFVHA